MKRRTQSPLLSFALAAVLLSTAVSAEKSLADIMRVNSIPEQCLRIYETPIPGCTERDFESQTCSAACIRGLTSMQTSIQQNCANVRTRSDTLLGQTILGNLVGIICRGNVRQSTSTPVVTPTPTTTVNRNTPTSEGESRTTIPTSLVVAPSFTFVPINSDVGQGTDDAQPPQQTDSNDNDNNNNSNGSSGKSGDKFDRPQGAGGSPFDIVASPSIRLEPVVAQVLLAALVGIATILGQ